MAKIETTFIRPQEVFTPDTGKAKVVYDGYQNNPHEIVLQENLDGDVEEIVNDTFVPNNDGNVVFTDNNETEHELLTAQGLGKAQVIATTWSALKALRDGGNLVAGSLYRITDYVTTTAQENTQSAGHQFDVIVLALSNNKLTEDAWAMLHDGDTYFANSNLSAWKLRYCLDNDVARFAWADDNVPQIYSDSIWFSRDSTKDEDGYFAWYNTDEDSAYFTTTETPHVGDSIYLKEGDSWEEEDIVVEALKGFGRGVIYRLIDEFNNDLPYDFKNIQFPIPLTSGVYDSSSESSEYGYTFCSNFDDNDNCTDLSLDGTVVSNNSLKCYIEEGVYLLPDVVFFANGGESSDVFFRGVSITDGSSSFILVSAVNIKTDIMSGCIMAGQTNVYNIGELAELTASDVVSDKCLANGVEITTSQGE